MRVCCNVKVSCEPCAMGGWQEQSQGVGWLRFRGQIIVDKYTHAISPRNSRKGTPAKGCHPPTPFFVNKEEYDKLRAQGLNNTQIYNALVQSGLTPDQLAPLARYINANAKVQGMVDGTQKRIEENVQKRLLDWGYKGKLNDTDVKGQSVVFVTDKNGRLLIVGSGDISFDPQGRAREDVGDMITVLDPQTNEMDFISVKDVKLDHVETAEDYGNKYRQYLQELNSKAYAEAQAEQA